MNTRIASWLIAAVALTPAYADARPSRAAAPLVDPAQRAAVDWQPLALAPVTLKAGDPWSAAPSAAATAGEVVVGPGRGALVRLGALQTMRIRAERAGRSGRGAPLKFVRTSAAPAAGELVASPAGRVAVEEAGLEVSPGTWLIEQPPGGAGDWLITAAEPTKIVALGPVPRRGELIWEHAAGALLEWVLRGGELPPLPEVADEPIVRRELLADAAIAEAVRASDPNDKDLQEAVRHWRAAAALQRLSQLRSPDRPTFAMETGPRALQNTRELADEFGRPWRSADGGKTWELTMTGPGVAWIAARHSGHDPEASLVVSVAGRRLGRVDLQPAPEGQLYGPTRRVAVPLARGEHTYRLRVSDGALLDVRVGKLNERLATALRGEGIDDFVRKARRALTRTTSKRAYLVDALLATVDGRASVGELDPGTSPALALTIAWLQGQEDGLSAARRRKLARELALHAELVDDPALADRARAAALDMLEGSADQSLARRLAGPHAADLPAPTLGRLARLIEGPPLPIGSPALALFEEARRRAPYDLALRDAYREHWAESTRWSTLQEDDGSAPSLQWIEPLPDDAARAPMSSSLWSLAIGANTTFTAEPLPEAPTRPALLRLYAHMADGSGPVGVAVDDRRWQTLPLAPLEKLSVAVPPGEHKLAVSAPKGARMWSSLRPGQGRAPDARLLRMWQVTADAPARFLLPGQPSFARVEVRALDGDAPRRVRLLVKSDAGRARSVEVELLPGSELVPVEGAPKAGAVATAVIPIDPRSKSLEIAVARGGPRVAVTAAIRSPGVRDAEPVEPARPGSKGHAPPASYEQSLQIVEDTSRELLAKPDDPDLLLARAAALLDVGQRVYAVADFNRVLARPLNSALHPRAVAFAARLEALGSPRHIEVKTDVPVIVAPALAVADLDAADLERLAPVADRARASGPLAGLQALATIPGEPRGDRPAAGVLAAPESMSKTTGSRGPGPSDLPGPLADPAAEALRASLLDAAGRPAEAASAWARVFAATGSWQTGLAGVESALAALDDPATAPDGAGVAFGLAVQVRPTVRTSALDRLTAIAGERSRWSRLIMSERRAHQDTRALGPRPEPVTPRASVRAAMLTTPWPIEEREVLRPGAPLTIDLSRAPSSLTFDTWCRNVRPDLGTGDPTLRFYAGEELLLAKSFKADVAGEARITLPDTYNVTVELDGSDRGHLCAVRMRDGGARASAPPSRWHVARSGRPLEFVVLGPTTVEIEAYSQDSAAGRRLAVALGRGDAGGFEPARTITLSTLTAPQTMSDAPSIAPEVLTLPEPGPYRIQLTPDDGAAVVRLRQRLDDQARAAPPRSPPLARDPETQPAVDDPAASPLLELEAGARLAPKLPAGAKKVQKFGTTFGELHMGTDDLEEADDFRPRISGVVRLGYARELLKNRLWIEVEPEIRPREQTAMVAGGRLTLQGYMPKAGLRMRVSGLGLAQFESGLTPWSARGEFRLDRPTWVAPRVQLLPGVEAYYRYQSLGDDPPLPIVELHPRVYQTYVEQHPFALRPSFDVRFVPWQDARIVVGADVVPNSDFRSLDQVNMHAGINGVPVLYAKVVPEFVLDYEASIRLKDADRSETYLRSRILAGFGVAFWAGDVARIALGVRDSLYLSAPFPARNGLDLWLRVDLPFGRGLRDFGPFAMPFRAAREHRLWR